MIPIIAPPATVPPPVSTADDQRLWQAARQLEASFLSEMLKSAGLGAQDGQFGGGIGEEQFASYLREEHAGAIVDAGGIGLAESLFHALKARSHV